MTTDPLQALFVASNQPVNNLSPSSRYYPVGTATIEKSDGTSIAYIKRRFIPQPELFEVKQLYVVKQGDRLDNIANAAIGDVDQFWQIADANVVIAPEELTNNPGKILKIT